MGGMRKGSSFEREICKSLSLWWTGGKRDDIFWRTSGSGARATVRYANGKQRTFGQWGDIQAIDPIGQPLIDLCLIELKRGYGAATIFDLIDKPDNAAEQTWEHWLDKIQRERVSAKRPYWILISKRDRHKIAVTIPKRFYKQLASPYGEMGIDLAMPYAWARPIKSGALYITTLDAFLNCVSPKLISTLYISYKLSKNEYSGKKSEIKNGSEKRR